MFIFYLLGVNRSGIHRCPPGFFCPAGTGYDWRSCPRGTYGEGDGLTVERDCKPCDSGKFCNELNSTSTSGDCKAGYYCISGVDTPTPQLTNLTHCPNAFPHLSVGGKCPAGSYCETSSPTYTACPAGQYTPNSGFPACLPCPLGYFCLNETSDHTVNRCPVGHYCPQGTKHAYEFQCPPGTFNPDEVTTNSSACLSCTPGKYCEGYGNEKPTNSCDAGYFCPGGNQISRPAAYECQPRFYCPIESSKMTECTAGSYCQTPRLPAPTAECDAGYYCPNGSASAQEKDCYPGHYCEKGSDLPTSCDMGTFLAGSRATSKDQCSNCTAGSYCDSTGLPAVSGPCAPGYYCPGGQKDRTPSEYQCPKGHYCIEGSFEPARCANGTYQDQTGSWECKECPTGYYCDNTQTAVDSLAGRECPMGHFCPKGTRYENEHPCLSGTWSNQTGLQTDQACDPCPPK